MHYRIRTDPAQQILPQDRLNDLSVDDLSDL